jgi:hypothetical protein
VGCAVTERAERGSGSGAGSGAIAAGVGIGTEVAAFRDSNAAKRVDMTAIV